MELTQNTIVKLRNGIVGLVVFFNNQPAYIILPKFIKRMSQYDSELKYKTNHDYDIVEIYDGSSLEDVSLAFRSRFNLDSFPLIAKVND